MNHSKTLIQYVVSADGKTVAEARSSVTVNGKENITYQSTIAKVHQDGSSSSSSSSASSSIS